MQVAAGLLAVLFILSLAVFIISVLFLASPAKRPKAKKIAFRSLLTASVSFGLMLAVVPSHPPAAPAPVDPRQEQLERNQRAADDRKAELARRESRNCTDDGLFFVMAQRFVKDRLKAPSTADFPWSATAVTPNGHCRHMVLGYVDAQNGFGAMIRSNWIVDLEYLPNVDKWQAHDVQIQ